MRRRGFTLIELLVYLALVATALVVFGGIELNAQRSAGLQRALLDIDMQANGYLGALRRDVEAARRVEVAPKQLLVHRFDGTSVLYKVGERVVLDADGKQTGGDRFHLVEGLTVEQVRGSKRMTITCELAAQTERQVIKRTFTRSATPRREVSDG